VSGRPIVALVLNPVKVDDVDDLAERLRDGCRSLGLADPIVLATTEDDPGAGQAAKALAAGATVVVAAGGDSTVRVVAEALTGTGVPLAVLPQGTGNLLARNLGLPLDLDDALQTALNGDDRPVDVGRLVGLGTGAGGQVFTVMAGAGLDAAMMREAPEALKGIVGWPAYLVGVVRGLRRSRLRVEVVIDDAPPVRAHVRTALIANVGTLQGGLQLAPDARADDGLLDVVLVAPRRAVDWAVLVARGLIGRGRQDHRLRTYQGRSVQIRMRRAHPRQLDGDLIADDAYLAARVEQGALTVRFPRSQAAAARSFPEGETARTPA
jgi:diacylglycerol kinase (ATP)